MGAMNSPITFYSKRLRPCFLATTVLWAMLLASSGWANSSGEPESDSATTLAQRVYDRPNGKDVSSEVLMVLDNGRDEPRQRRLYNFAKDKGDSERWTLLRFHEPADISGTALLTKDYRGDESDQWLYLPALDRVRRISSARKGGRFVGSDFFYEDLMDREVSMDNHRILGMEKLGGIDCYLLESTPVDPDTSVYSKRISWIHPGLDLTLRVEFYKGRGNKPYKRLQARKIKKVQGYWTVFDSTMYNLKTGHKTQLLTLDIRYNPGLPDDLFTQRSLADPSREASYIP